MTKSTSILHIGNDFINTIYYISKYNKKGFIPIIGAYGFRNWGDQLNTTLLPLLSGKKPVIVKFSNSNKSIYPFANRINKWINGRIDDNFLERYAAVGSILQWIDIPNVVVWGSGFIYENSRLLKEPKSILAVRGPLSADKISDQYGITTKIFGDPAVLYSLYYKPNIPKKYKLGIIPHYVDYKRIKLNFSNMPNVKIIDIMSGINSVIDDILSCETIASSSLHGLIISEAYNIPTTWIEWIAPSVDYFKYYDYYSSINCDKEMVSLQKSTSIDDIVASSELPSNHINMKKLLSVCPFYDDIGSPIKI